ncbi:hypothetical protein ABK905_24810 [Acerihabitans sp. KWT182]|uniref:Uncharacterized protein n=1 Tax=Acerihabitans sp. KWT182 TaxID=3157919 RepID=A0AAU7Q8S0_9GAMM
MRLSGDLVRLLAVPLRLSAVLLRLFPITMRLFAALVRRQTMARFNSGYAAPRMP